MRRQPAGAVRRGQGAPRHSWAQLLKSEWHAPHKSKKMVAPHQPAGMRNPTRHNPPSMWRDYWSRNCTQLPSYLPLEGSDRLPSVQHACGHILLKYAGSTRPQRARTCPIHPDNGSAVLHPRAVLFLGGTWSVPCHHDRVVRRISPPLCSQHHDFRMSMVVRALRTFRRVRNHHGRGGPAHEEQQRVPTFQRAITIR